MKTRIMFVGNEKELGLLVDETRFELNEQFTYEKVVREHFIKKGFGPFEITGKFNVLLPPRENELARKMRVELGWYREEIESIMRMLVKANIFHTTQAHVGLFEEEELPAVRCARIRKRWKKVFEVSALESQARRSLIRESKIEQVESHTMDDVLDDVICELRSRCKGEQASIHEIDRWVDWLNEFVLPLVAVRAKTLSLARLDETTLALLDAMRANKTKQTEEALRAWVRAGMPDTTMQESLVAK